MNIFETKLKKTLIVDNTMEIYDKILTNTLHTYKNLLIINNQNLLSNIDKLGHYIKKYNLNITFYIENTNEKEEFLNKIKDEEYENNINVNDTLIFDDIIFDLIIIFRVYNKKCLNMILNSIVNYIDNSSFIYLYSSLCEKDDDIKTKSKIRDVLKKVTKLNFSTLMFYDEFIKIIKQHNNLKIIKENLFKETDYLIYGTNKLYEFILISD